MRPFDPRKRNGSNMFTIIFLSCTNVSQQENAFVTFFMGMSEFSRTYMYVKPQEK